MTPTDGHAEDTATESEDEGEEDGPPYSRLDEETAAKCGLWLGE